MNFTPQTSTGKEYGLLITSFPAKPCTELMCGEWREKSRGKLERRELVMTLNSAPVSSRNSYQLPSVLIDTRGNLRNASLDDGKWKKVWGLRWFLHPLLPRYGLPQVLKPENSLQERWSLLTCIRTPVAWHRSPDIVSLRGWHWRWVLFVTFVLSVDLIVPWFGWWL